MIYPMNLHHHSLGTGYLGLLRVSNTSISDPGPKLILSKALFCMLIEWYPYVVKIQKVTATRNSRNFKPNPKRERIFSRSVPKLELKLVPLIPILWPWTSSWPRLWSQLFSWLMRQWRHWNVISPPQMSGAMERPGSIKGHRCLRAFQPSLSHTHRGHSGMQESGGEVETCKQRAQSNGLTTGKKNKNKHAQK